LLFIPRTILERSRVLDGKAARHLPERSAREDGEVAKRRRQVRIEALKLLLAVEASIAAAWAAGEPLRSEPVQAQMIAREVTVRS
jgi:hypothetical protein